MCVCVYIYTCKYVHTYQILDGEGNPVVLAHLVDMYICIHTHTHTHTRYWMERETQLFLRIWCKCFSS
jgi:hypothetical protein